MGKHGGHRGPESSSNPMLGLHGWGLAAASIQDAGCSVSALLVVNCGPSACSSCPHGGNVFPGKTTGLTEQTVWFRILPRKQSRIPPGSPIAPGNLTLHTMWHTGQKINNGTCNCFVLYIRIPYIAMSLYSSQPKDGIKFQIYQSVLILSYVFGAFLH